MFFVEENLNQPNLLTTWVPEERETTVVTGFKINPEENWRCETRALKISQTKMIIDEGDQENPRGRGLSLASASLCQEKGF